MSQISPRLPSVTLRGSELRDEDLLVYDCRFAGDPEGSHAQLEQRAVSPSPAHFEPRDSGRTYGIGAAEILARLDDPGVQLVDVRGWAEFSGNGRRAARGGHIPGAIFWPWEKNLESDGNAA